jgi:hypothetical protein
MRTNECHYCGNYIEFPDHGAGDQIHCPHCQVAVVLTNSAKTLPAPPPAASAPAELMPASSEPKNPAERLPASDLVESSARQSVSPVDPASAALLRRLAVLGAVLFLIIAGLIAATRERQDKARMNANRDSAISKLAQDAVAAHAPAGLFDAKWLMSMDEVRKVSPNAKPMGAGVLGETRPFEGRPALVTYHFTNDTLLLATVRFLDPGTPSSFSQIQTRLAAKFGPMPAPRRTPNESLSSLKKIAHFVVNHSLEEEQGASVERVFFYVRGGGDPMGMPKAIVAPAR